MAVKFATIAAVIRRRQRTAAGDKTKGKKFPVFCFNSFLLVVPFLIFYHLDQSLLPWLSLAAESQGGSSNGNADV